VSDSSNDITVHGYPVVSRLDDIRARDAAHTHFTEFGCDVAFLLGELDRVIAAWEERDHELFLMEERAERAERCCGCALETHGGVHVAELIEEK